MFEIRFERYRFGQPQRVDGEPRLTVAAHSVRTWLDSEVASQRLPDDRRPPETGNFTLGDSCDVDLVAA
jgi:hypothetical protein